MMTSLPTMMSNEFYLESCSKATACLVLPSPPLRRGSCISPQVITELETAIFQVGFFHSIAAFFLIGFLGVFAAVQRLLILKTYLGE